MPAGEDFTMTACGVCETVSEVDEGMVACDSCNRWFHYRCVGVTEGVKDAKNWFCPDISCQKLAKKQEGKPAKNRKKATSGNESDKSSVTSESVVQTMDQKLKALEKERRAKEREMEEERVLKEKRMEMDRFLREKELAIQDELREKEMQQEKELLEAALQKKRNFLARVKAMRESYQVQMENIQQELAEGGNHLNKPSELCPKRIQSTERATESVQEQKASGSTKPEISQSESSVFYTHTPVRSSGIKGKINKAAAAVAAGSNGKPVYGNDKNDLDDLEEEEAQSSESDEDYPDESDEDPDEEEEETDDEHTEDEKGRYAFKNRQAKKAATAVVPHGLGPTKAQLSARNGITRKLPVFTGNPEEWPLFIGSYNASNTACGFSDVENLVRLQECLRGPALESVRSQLLLPQSVPRVINKLRQLYGRPEQLLHHHLDKIRKLECPKADKLSSYIPFGNSIEQLCDHLEAAELTQHLVNPLLIQDLVDKLPAQDKRDWVRYKQKKKRVTLRTFTDFVSRIVAEACEANVNMDFKTPQASSGPPYRVKREKGAVFNHCSSAETSTKSKDPSKLKPCKVCHRTDHRLRYCEDFKCLPAAERIKLVEQWKLCKICLNDHGKAQCKFQIRCRVDGCLARHNTLLHPIGGPLAINTHMLDGEAVLFRMIPVSLHCGEHIVETLAFLDEGASVTLVEKTLVDRLGVQGTRNPLTITWTADIQRTEKDSRQMNLWISTRGMEGKILLRTVQTVPELMLPQQTLNAPALMENYKFLQNLPVDSYYNKRPGILIGINNVHAIAPLESRLGTIGEPIAVRSKLGWTIYGPSQRTTGAQRDFVGCHHDISNQELHNVLKSHYALEESVVAVFQESKENQRARKILEETTVRIGDRFETGLLWNTDSPKFPNSLPMALRRLKQLEHRLENMPQLYESVRKQIVEYEQKGYAHRATPEEIAEAESSGAWYLPINVVLNPKKPGKVRLVWDAAASVQGVSLNSQLLTGPDMLAALPSVINRFRERPVAFGGDIREMYHQLVIRKADRRAQMFLFRNSTHEKPTVYMMDVAIFGSKCSPCQAQYIKNRNAKEFAIQYPEAAAAIIDKHYVDDYFDSTDTVEEATRIAKEVELVHSKGGFEIRNWVSNSREVLRSLGEKSADQAVHFNRDKETGTERVLGIIWNPKEDKFSFSTEHREDLKRYLSGKEIPTKRIVLSSVMGLFDPLGLLSTFIIHGRVLIQNLWRTGCDWDEQIDQASELEWRRWIGRLPDVEAVRIPRAYFGRWKSTEIETLQLHVFTDASLQAYGSAAYFRATVGGEVRCALVMARAKVAPLKRQSVPRLELMGALLGARLLQSVMTNHTLPIQKCYLWTDSQTVLSWLRSDQHSYKQFVAFRVGEIHELTNLTDWRKIPSKFNIADVLTKWGSGPDLKDDGSWFNGPNFLQQTEEYWPAEMLPEANIADERKAVVLVHGTCSVEPVIRVESFSRWIKLLRVTATVVRFINNCRRKIAKQPILCAEASEKQRRLITAKFDVLKRPLLQEELRSAECILWKLAQREGYAEEVRTLSRSEESGPGKSVVRLQRSSTLYKLTPFLDEEGVMRMGGRMQNSTTATFNEKYPIILPKDHEITDMLLQDYHEKFGHANRETIFHEVRLRFKIPKLRSRISRVVKNCVWCKVHRCKPAVPLMAPLPKQRITPGLRPFSAVGLDYLGPIDVSVGRRSEKRWICLFTCLAIRAIHLEVVDSLTTQSCLMAIRRFICKRGAPDEFFSDNGTNFRGAYNELKRTVERINNECAEGTTTARIKWNFNPPATPHMGGIWERLVRSVKEAFRALDDGRKLTDEILKTVVAEAEEMINSRPLTYMPDSSEDSALTPNHFLRGTVKESDTMFQDQTDMAGALRDTYQRSQFLAEEIWKRWCKEYLPTINQRTKWYTEQKPIRIGDLVFIVDGNNRKTWIRGIVEDVHAGTDGRIRRADVRTAKGVFRRAVANLARMEISDGKSGNSEPEAPELRAGDVSSPLG
ncbi:uncharacterized protein LOC115254910 [Aedes albopictus]|uniref:Uncharacterized protein n=1 Tax=Aedes albopictus TaxID=7160 RepID=A0ABM1YGE3_AEDAL